jgi:hypothetical protein
MGKKDKSAIINQEQQSRMKLFREAMMDGEKRSELENSIIGSEVLIRFEIFLPSPKSGKFSDGIFLYMNDSGEIVDAEYYIREADEVTIAGFELDDLKVIKELFKNSFSLEVE